ncbi:MAG: TonB-dependent receptor, partial [Novosphingobium sp.]
RPELFDSDSVWSYEVGTKTRLFDRRLQFDASAFRIDWNNIQQTIQLTQCGFNYTANLGKARSTGFDIQFQLRATDSLTLGGAVGYTDAKFTQTIKAGPAAAANLVTAGDKIPLNPWQITFNGQYDFAVAGKDAYIRADFQHLSRQTGATQQRDPANGGADLTIPGIPETNNLSLRAGVTLEPVELSFFVNNVTNDRPLLLRQHDVVYSTLYRNATARPRTFGMTAIVRY